jgi:hypothetical protein
MGCRPEEAYPQVLQDLLDARGRQAEVFNVAFSGWSTRQERIAYERIGRRYHPDDVVVAVCLNDIPEIHNNLSRPHLCSRPCTRGPRWCAAWWARGAARSTTWRSSSRPPSPRTCATRSRASSRSSGSFAREVEADGARLSLAVFPFRMQLASAEPPSVQERIAAFAAAERIPALDLLPVLRPMGESGFLDYDHLSASGARRVAEALAEPSFSGHAERWARHPRWRDGGPRSGHDGGAHPATRAPP